MSMKLVCHTGNREVFTKDNVVVYGGGWNRGATVTGCDYVLDLCGKFDRVVQMQFPSWWKAGQYAKKILSLPIKDYEAPDVPPEFWYDLWSDLLIEATIHEKPLKILVACVGGHGRTGTVLSCLAHAAEVPVGVDELVWLRDVYCPYAVESEEQIEYLKDVVGINTAYQIIDLDKTPISISQGGKEYVEDWNKNPLQKLAFMNNLHTVDWMPEEVKWVYEMEKNTPIIVSTFFPKFTKFKASELKDIPKRLLAVRKKYQKS